MRQLVVGVLLLTALASCKLFIFRVGVQPASLVIPQGLSNFAMVSLERDPSFKDNVTCKLIQASGAAMPTGIATAFDPLAFDGSTGSAKMNITIAETAAVTAKPIEAQVECASGSLYNFAEFRLEVRAKPKL